MQKERVVKQRLFAISVLRQLKKTRTYNELSKMLRIPVPVLSRYVMGHTLPSESRSKEVINKYKRMLVKEVKKSINVDERGHFNHLPLLFNTNLLHHIACMVASEFSFLKINKVLTVSTDGLPLAYLLALELGVDVVYAKKNKEVGVENFIEHRVFVEGSAYNYSLFIPATSLKQGDNVLIVDDAIRSTTTAKSLVRICERVKAVPVGIFSLISANGGVQKLAENYSFPIKTLITL